MVGRERRNIRVFVTPKVPKSLSISTSIMKVILNMEENLINENLIHTDRVKVNMIANTNPGVFLITSAKMEGNKVVIRAVNTNCLIFGILCLLVNRSQ